MNFQNDWVQIWLAIVATLTLLFAIAVHIWVVASVQHIMGGI